VIRAVFSIVLTAAAASVVAAEKKIPAWLDTMPPKVTVSPRIRTHNKTFSVIFGSDEDAVIRYGINSSVAMQQYAMPVMISQEGRTVVYFYGEDNMGNTSPLDSVEYILDTKAPALQMRPQPGRYGAALTVYLSCDEPCTFFFHRDSLGGGAKEIPDTIVVTRQFEGFITAQDNAGNRSTSGRLSYIVDTSTAMVKIEPAEGVYNRPVTVHFTASKGADVYFSFDPAAAPQWFTPFTSPVVLPYGLTSVRFYAKTPAGQRTDIMKARFVIDTIAPKIRAQVRRGVQFDTLVLSTREPSMIFFATRPETPAEGTAAYRNPVVVARKGTAYVKAFARDSAGNVSEWYEWSCKYDTTVPSVSASLRSGTYTKPLELRFTTSEPADVHYTLDGRTPDNTSTLYRAPIAITKSGVTVVKFCAVDESGNMSAVDSVVIRLDVTAPSVRARIDGSVTDTKYRVTLTSSEGARIHFETGERTPDESSPVYTNPVPLKPGEVLRYFAVDSAGNRSKIFVLDELKKPVVEVAPPGGVFSAPVTLRLSTSMTAEVYWRTAPDSAFVHFRDSIVLDREGLHTVEYYSESPAGLRSPVKRTEYLVDWTPPQVNAALRKGVNDSIIVFLEANENVTFYYTLDGSNPVYSATANVAANKFFLSRDRLVLQRTADTKLTFFAEDLAGNQSPVTILDLFKPRAVPNIPAGRTIVYDRMLSVALNTYDDKSQIYFERHGKTPTLQSPLYTGPITLLKSDTITAFVVDASGTRGDIDTFVYILDLAPSPYFVFSPDTAEVGDAVAFDASATFDQESPIKRLTFAWDFDGDGKTDMVREGAADAAYAYTAAGRYAATLTVTDPGRHSAQIVREILVRGRCPDNMVSVIPAGVAPFCIDRYEWPNRAGKTPQAAVSWVRAHMYCSDEGKRLCTAEEWRSACSGGADRAYPYGPAYESGRCPCEGEAAHPSGRFPSCNEGFGLHDMTGNLWEWVADKSGMRARLAGGSYKSRAAAHCGLVSEGSIVEQSEDVGFRCCK